MTQPNRLSTASEHSFHGRQIDRSRPLRFRLDGRDIDGFWGDTIFSALLANAVTGLGRHGKAQIGLTPACAPFLFREGDAKALPFPSARTPATDGARWRTRPAADGEHWAIGMLAGARRLLQGPSTSLGLPLSESHDLGSPPVTEMSVDLLVVGGGVAGLGAARRAGDMRKSVALIEQRPYLGGLAPYYGRLEGEDRPEDLVQRLIAELAQRPTVAVLLASRALHPIEGGLRVHQVLLEAGKPVVRLVDIRARRIVLATGTLDRLPVFPGNRLPGVLTLSEAFALADGYGVWLGRESVIASGTNVAYRLATKARDADIKVLRVMDTRLDPQSRFIEFAKAYGITMAPGQQVKSVASRNARLVIGTELSFPLPGTQRSSAIADSLLVSAGTRPSLSLWQAMGGETQALADGTDMASGALGGVLLAGSVAGYKSMTGCMISGWNAAAQSFGASQRKLQDIIIDERYETPDGAVAPQPGEQAYLSDESLILAEPGPGH